MNCQRASRRRGGRRATVTPRMATTHRLRPIDRSSARLLRAKCDQWSICHSQDPRARREIERADWERRESEPKFDPAQAKPINGLRRRSAFRRYAASQADRSSRRGTTNPPGSVGGFWVLSFENQRPLSDPDRGSLVFNPSGAAHHLPDLPEGRSFSCADSNRSLPHCVPDPNRQLSPHASRIVAGAARRQGASP